MGLTNRKVTVHGWQKIMSAYYRVYDYRVWPLHLDCLPKHWNSSLPVKDLSFICIRLFCVSVKL